MTSEEKIKAVGQEVIDLLVYKNRSYGDSALKPANIFARGSAVENLCSRIDDKLMRIKNKGIGDSTEDTVKDLIGYLILLKVALDNEDNSKGSADHDDRQHQGNEGAPLQDGWVRTFTYPTGEEQIYS